MVMWLFNVFNFYIVKCGRNYNSFDKLLFSLCSGMFICLIDLGVQFGK